MRTLPDPSNKRRIKPIGLGSVRKAACYDPRIAYAMAKGIGAGIGLGLSGWEIFNIKGVFAAGDSAGKVINAILGREVEVDLLIRKVTYTVQYPQANVGSPGQGLFAYFNKLSPNIEFELTINAIINYVISLDFTPLENIEETFECICPAGLALTASTTIQAHFRTIAAIDPAQGPVQPVITLHGQRLPYGVYSSCDAGTALKWLVEHDYLTDTEYDLGGAVEEDDSGE